MDGSGWNLRPVSQWVARSDILHPASLPRRLSRTIRTPVRTIFSGHFARSRAVGMRIERSIDKSPVVPYLRLIKTTIELPDALACKVKMLAAEHGTTLRALVLQGSEHVIMEKQVSSKDRAKSLFAAMDQASGITAGKRLNRTEANAR